MILKVKSKCNNTSEKWRVDNIVKKLKKNKQIIRKQNEKENSKNKKIKNKKPGGAGWTGGCSNHFVGLGGQVSSIIFVQYLQGV